MSDAQLRAAFFEGAMFAMDDAERTLRDGPDSQQDCENRYEAALEKAISEIKGTS